MAYDNHSNLTTFIKKTGAEIVSNNYVVDISTLLDSTSQLGSTVADQDEIVVVRKFDHSTISPATTITADEAWSLWTLPNTDASGSTMYSLSGTQITFSQTASDYTWTATQSGRASDLTIPTIASGDEIYILRKTFSLSKFVEYAQGSKITSKNLNMQNDQAMYLNQEVLQLFFNMHSLNPSVGQASGICPLNASGTIDASFIDGNSLAIQTELGVQGDGTSSDKLRLKINGDSLNVGTDGVSVNTINNLTSTSTTSPLSAAQGKALNDSIVSIGAGIVYKGGVDVAATNTLGTPAAGWTVTHTGADTTSRGTGWLIDTTGDGSNDSGTVSKGDVLRYDGAQWDVVSTTAFLTADGTTGLTGDWAAGDTRTISAKTQSTSDSSTNLATTAFVAAKIAATTLDDLAEVDTDHAVADGDIIKRVSGEFAFVAPNDGTNGISINDLNNVTGTNAAGKILQYVAGSTNAWEVTALPSSLRSTQTLVDENTTTHTQVQSAFDSSSFGFLTDGSKASTTVNELNGANLTYACTDELTLRDAADRVIKDITLHYTVNNARENFLLTNGGGTTFDGSARAYSAAVQEDSKAGQTRITVANGEGANFPVGTSVFFQSHYTDATNANTKANTWATILPEPATGNVDYTAASYYANDGGYEVIDVEGTNGGNEYIYLDRPLDHDMLGQGKIYKYGTDDGSNNKSERECRNLTFENVTFKDTLSQMFYTQDAGGANDDGDESPITFNKGARK